MPPTDSNTLNVAGSGIAYVILGIMAFLAYALVYVPIPEANMQMFSTLLGLIGTLAAGVGGFYFGSSSAAKKQSDTINTMAATAAVTAANPPLPPKEDKAL